MSSMKHTEGRRPSDRERLAPIIREDAAGLERRPRSAAQSTGRMKQTHGEKIAAGNSIGMVKKAG
ncbi:hypothetical protein OCU04_007238 [Sclerotinia nivalis]|uniref:Uncharacterized protein n=1 Tax=Sclerotinia nivalis TaxID=352851 RepID=A0A9X0ALE4_9HELO|nr:hypothetical protein OCU04_007238 [Sclerotinia nivalis]